MKAIWTLIAFGLLSSLVPGAASDVGDEPVTECHATNTVCIIYNAEAAVGCTVEFGHDTCNGAGAFVAHGLSPATLPGSAYWFGSACGSPLNGDQLCEAGSSVLEYWDDSCSWEGSVPQSQQPQGQGQAEPYVPPQDGCGDQKTYDLGGDTDDGAGTNACYYASVDLSLSAIVPGAEISGTAHDEEYKCSDDSF